jgi:UDP-N-acetyl-D-glucosamine dehydrogenase
MEILMNDAFNNLITRLDNKKSIIGVIGLGYVGLPLLLAFIENGYQTIGFDIDINKINKLKRGKSYIRHISDTRIESCLKKSVEFSNNFELSEKADALIICVPTPLNHHLEPDLTYINSTLDSLQPHLRPGQVISLESTTYPGTTEEVLVPRVEFQNLEVGKDVFVVYSPEREDPGNTSFNTNTIPKVCGGITSNCLEIAKALYKNIIHEVIPVRSTKIAEMTKLLENIHRAVNIGLVNELKTVCDLMDIDIFEVIQAASTKPFGFVPYYPGPGLGGHCIPIDPFYLTWKAKEYGLHTRFIELAGEINSSMPKWVFHKVSDALNSKKKSLNGSALLILGIAYKKNIEDCRESPAIDLIELLLNKGALVHFSDPYISDFPKVRGHSIHIDSTHISADSIEKFDAVILCTDHDIFDYNLIYQSARLIIDTRGRFDAHLSKVIRA